ncbi:hypothetical protein PV08_02119 [Exophiala spinifera]|uniref:N-acetyltransferase domain-containing protein n=1 Tax=Exophiala spinifera TaxID=91928 RepID=A0A0D2CDE9_9EURO|nr:uncharacterized protein PV08_02119 [Exophiala spinifera]KIW21539.1 hypothetical protein PV08_02119 [Exophiala spinifera]
MSTTTTNLSPGIHLIGATTPEISTIVSSVVHLHATCILNDYTLATFLPPLSYDLMTSWWRQRFDEVTTGARHIVIQVSEVSERSSMDLAAPWASEGRGWPLLENGLEVSGVVTLSTPFSQTGPFRAVVQKLFVSPLHRQRGIAKRMLVKLEDVALAHDRWNLMLDTSVGSEADKVYPRLGYERLGIVREYGISPKDGRPVDEVWYWKDLRKHRIQER